MDVRPDPGKPTPTARVILRPSFYVWRMLIWGVLLLAGMQVSRGLRALQDGKDARDWGLSFGWALVIVLVVPVMDVRMWRDALTAMRRLGLDEQNLARRAAAHQPRSEGDGG